MPILHFTQCKCDDKSPAEENTDRSSNPVRCDVPSGPWSLLQTLLEYDYKQQGAGVES